MTAATPGIIDRIAGWTAAYDRRSAEVYQRFGRHRPEYRYRYPFVYLGGPRIVVGGYGPGWCRGLHRGYHWAPRVGWHYGAHRGLYRCW